MFQITKVSPAKIMRAIIRAEVLFGLGFFAGAAFGGFWRGLGHGMGWW